MKSALGNESEHVPDKTSSFAVSDKQKTTFEEAAVNKNTKKSTVTCMGPHVLGVG